MDQNIVSIIISIIVLVVFFLIFLISREFTCWYFKQTEIVNLLKQIRDKHEK